MKRSRLKMAALALSVLTIGACSFMQDKPDEPDQMATIAAFAGTASLVCGELGPKGDDGAQLVQTFDKVLIPSLVPPAPGSGGGGSIGDVLEEINRRAPFITALLTSVRSYANRRGYVDTDATYWGMLQAAVAGCRDGLQAALASAALLDPLRMLERDVYVSADGGEHRTGRCICHPSAGGDRLRAPAVG